uniref:PREDICTED: similar to OSJNBa0011F23.1 putative n=1 Tax=Albugo laibachii Nc14 TaxID=890382 RepID=F0W7B6_9STRA|nr:PREDICTED: similar to OSJNBa0011F23.1 putative [Albugo laibachii Nc14]|eukprot:CCA17015.1 PREDICTED: similar to OSJNBa0011F23.1 putative [Albugo laibachii Nc14]
MSICATDGFSTLGVEVQCVFSDCFVGNVPRYIPSINTLLFLPLKEDSSCSEAVSGPVLKRSWMTSNESMYAELDAIVSDGEEQRIAPTCRILDSCEEVLHEADEESMDDREIQMDTVRTILKSRLEEVKAAGASKSSVDRLELVLAKYENVFRVEFAADPPVKVPALKVRLKEGVEPIMAGSRRKTRFNLSQSRLTLGSAPRIVSKKETGDYRMTVDLRAVNAATVPMSWPMPHLEVLLASLEGAKCYFSLDCFRFYWQLPLDKDSRDYFTVVTPGGLYTGKGVVMGSTDAVAFAQQVAEQVMKPVLHHGVQVWLDDFLGYAETESKLIDVLEVVLSRCEEYGVKLHPKKCVFLAFETIWCGKKILGNGVSHCTARIQGLCDTGNPITASDLQQFLCAVNWMRNNIPNYSQLVQDLHELLEDAMKAAKCRKKRKLVQIRLAEYGWSSKHHRCRQNVKEALYAMVPMAHPKDDWDVCVYTDASKDHRGAIVTQVEPGKFNKTFVEQDHYPLAFISGSFKGTSARWATVEKEVFLIVETCKRLEYLLLREKAEVADGKLHLDEDKDTGVLVDSRQRIWIPDGAADLQQRLCVVAHAGSAGHRGLTKTMNVLSNHLVWSSMNHDVKEFVLRCLRCLLSRGGKCPRPFGEPLRSTKPNKILHFDYLAMPRGDDELCYVLVLKGRMSGFCELVPTTMANTDVTVHAILDWFIRYGLVSVWVSDRGSHFKNEVMAKLCKLLGTQHHFVTAYCPWANGSVEVLNRQLLKTMRSLLSERKLKFKNWPVLLPFYQSAVNQVPSSRLGGIAPVTGFAALPAGDPISLLYQPARMDRLRSMTLLEVQATQKQTIVELQEKIDRTHHALSDVTNGKL